MRIKMNENSHRKDEGLIADRRFNKRHKELYRDLKDRINADMDAPYTPEEREEADKYNEEHNQVLDSEYNSFERRPRVNKNAIDKFNKENDTEYYYDDELHAPNWKGSGRVPRNDFHDHPGAVFGEKKRRNRR